MDNNLDKFFKKKIQDRSFDFEESYWADMEAKLDALQAVNRKRPGYLWIIFLLFGLSLPSILYFLHKDQSIIDKTLISSSEEIIATNQLDNQSNLSSKNISSSIDAKFANTEDKNGLNSIQAKNVESNTNSSIPPSIPTESYRTAKSIKEATEEPYKISASEEKNRHHQTVENAPEEDFIVESGNMHELNETQVNLIVKQQSLAIISPQLISHLDHRIHSFDDLSIITITDDERYGAKVVRRMPFSYGLTGGATASNELFGFSGGLVFRWDFHPIWNFQFGPRYLRLSGSSPVTKSKGVVEYGFRAENQTGFLKANSFHFVDFPLSVNFSYFSHQIGLVFNAKYLAGIRGEISKRDVENTLVEQRDTWIVTDGFHRLIPAAGINYAYNLDNRFSINAVASYSFQNFGDVQYALENNLAIGLEERIRTEISLSYYFNQK